MNQSNSVNNYKAAKLLLTMPKLEPTPSGPLVTPISMINYLSIDVR